MPVKIDELATYDTSAVLEIFAQYKKSFEFLYRSSIEDNFALKKKWYELAKYKWHLPRSEYVAESTLSDIYAMFELYAEKVVIYYTDLIF